MADNITLAAFTYVSEMERKNKDLDCRVFVKPMANHIFNHSKSNCSWIETTYAGMVTVAPTAFPEFDKPGIVRNNYHGEAVNRLMYDDMYYQHNFELSVNYIRDNLLLSKVNELRKHLITK